MNTHGVKVFHGADGDHVSRRVPHGLKLDLLPAENRPLHQNLCNGGRIQSRAGDHLQLLRILGRTAARAAQREGRANDHGIADLIRYGKGLAHGLRDIGGDHRLPDGLHGLLKQLPVLRPGDGGGVGAKQADTLPLQKALFPQLHGDGQTGLSAQGGKNAVGPFLLNNAFHRLGGERLQINFIRHGLIGHNSGGVGVAQDHLHSRLFQNAAGLRPGIVKLSGLSDDNRAGADHEDLLNRRIQWHYRSPPFIIAANRSNRNPVSFGPVQASG
ncbi:hypothetical protein SDC9_85695 [bioreactor metagenome]|uniref:Uncharacterized protein n=1 Tax=bioreactor metagenome TaxID=1076179 RepID=A0A644ZMU9_9ZZZZ